MSQPDWNGEKQQPFNSNPGGYGTVPTQQYNSYQSYYNPQYAVVSQQPIPPSQYIPQNQYNNTTDYNDQQSMVPKTNTEENRFNYEEHKYRDVLWTILFLIQLCTIIILSILYYKKHSSDLEVNESSFVNKNFWTLSIAVTLIGIGNALLWIFFIKSFSYCLIWFSLFLSLSMWVVFGVVCIIINNVFGAIVSLLCAIMQCVWMYFIRHRIKFASVILRIAVEAVDEMTTNYFISFVSIIVQTCWMIIWLMGIAFVIYDQQKSNDDNSENNNKGLIFLYLLSFYWTSQVIANVVHVTAAGSIATWYFFSPNSTPKNPVWNSFKRATTTSFGSICLGSFIIAIVQALRTMIHAARQSDNTFLRACAECLLNCIENIINYFNLYAFTKVAIYGYSYCVAAKETWNLFKSKGLEMVINDDLINGVLFLACLFAGLLSGGMAMCLAKWGFNISDWELWSLVGFIIGFGLTLCAIVIIRSSVATLFVCFVEDPAALNMTKPHLSDELTEAWKQRYGDLPST